MKDEALRLALEALEPDWELAEWYVDKLRDKAISAIKQALAQPEQEPMTEDEIQRMAYQFKAAQTLGQSFYAVVRATELFHGIRKK